MKIEKEIDLISYISQMTYGNYYIINFCDWFDGVTDKDLIKMIPEALEADVDAKLGKFTRAYQDNITVYNAYCMDKNKLDTLALTSVLKLIRNDLKGTKDPVILIDNQIPRRAITHYVENILGEYDLILIE